MTSCINHFARLGVDISASEDDIKKAYRALAKKWHPDKNKEKGATEKFQNVAASYEFLSNNDRREMHQRELNIQVPTAPPAAQTNSTRTHSQTKVPPSSQYRTKKASGAAWSDSFTQNYQRKQARNHSTNGPPVNPFSHDFKHKKDQDPLSSMADEMFGFGLGQAGMTVASKKKQRERHVAPETGYVAGLDESYLFSPRQQPHHDRHENELPCPWCGETFTEGKLFQHEEKCGKFGLSADEDDGEDSDSDERRLTFLRQPRPFRKPAWQCQHEDLISRIQRDKINHRHQPA